LKTSQHETNLKHENFTVSVDIIYTCILVAIVQDHHQQFGVYKIWVQLEWWVSRTTKCS